MVAFLNTLARENSKEVESVTAYDIHVYVLQKKKQAVAKFSELAKRILNEPICCNFAHCGDLDAPADMSKLLKMVSSLHKRQQATRARIELYDGRV